MSQSSKHNNVHQVCNDAVLSGTAYWPYLVRHHQWSLPPRSQYRSSISASLTLVHTLFRADYSIKSMVLHHFLKYWLTFCQHCAVYRCSSAPSCSFQPCLKGSLCWWCSQQQTGPAVQAGGSHLLHIQVILSFLSGPFHKSGVQWVFLRLERLLKANGLGTNGKENNQDWLYKSTWGLTFSL